jgi:arsenate reductase (glutaredoxin)
MKTTIYHNPSCGTSRTALGLLRERGVEPLIVDYLKAPPSRDEWAALIERSGLGVRAFLRTKEKLYGELDLGNEKWSDAELLGFLTDHPALFNRPVVETTAEVRVCRPPETVLELQLEKP